MMFGFDSGADPAGHAGGGASASEGPSTADARTFLKRSEPTSYVPFGSSACRARMLPPLSGAGIGRAAAEGRR